MSFLSKKKLSKTIKYYITEVLIVTIGIFVAIQLNNWNENIKNKKEEHKSLKRIYSDLETEKNLLQYYVSDISNSNDFLKGIVYEKKRNNLDSLYIHASKAFDHYKFNSEYINLKYSGKLNLISNEDLRFLLVRYYEAGYAFYQEISKSHKKFIHENVNAYFKEKFPRDTVDLLKPKLVLQKLENQEIINILIDQINQYSYINKNVRVNETEFLLESIKEELDNN